MAIKKILPILIFFAVVGIIGGIWRGSRVWFDLQGPQQSELTTNRLTSIIAGAVWWNPFSWFKGLSPQRSQPAATKSQEVEVRDESGQLPRKIFITEVLDKDYVNTALKEKTTIKVISPTLSYDKNISGYKIDIPSSWYVLYTGVNFTGGFTKCSPRNPQKCRSSFSIGPMLKGIGAAPEEYFTYEGALAASDTMQEIVKDQASKLPGGDSRNYSMKKLENLISGARVIREEIEIITQRNEYREWKYYIYFDNSPQATNKKFVVEAASDEVEPILATMRLYDLNDPDVRDVIRISRLYDLVTFRIPEYFNKHPYKKTELFPSRSGREYEQQLSVGHYPRILSDLSSENPRTILVERLTDPLDNNEIAYSPYIKNKNGKEYIMGYHIGVSLENKENPYLLLGGCNTTRIFPCPSREDYEQSTHFNGQNTKGCRGEEGRYCFDIVCSVVPHEYQDKVVPMCSIEGRKDIFSMGAPQQLYRISPKFVAKQNALEEEGKKQIANPANAGQRDEKRILDIFVIEMALFKYKEGNNTYPKDLSRLAPSFLDSVPVDPKTGVAYHYSVHKVTDKKNNRFLTVL